MQLTCSYFISPNKKKEKKNTVHQLLTTVFTLFYFSKQILKTIFNQMSANMNKMHSFRHRLSMRCCNGNRTSHPTEADHHTIHWAILYNANSTLLLSSIFETRSRCCILFSVIFALICTCVTVFFCFFIGIGAANLTNTQHMHDHRPVFPNVTVCNYNRINKTKVTSSVRLNSYTGKDKVLPL